MTGWDEQVAYMRESFVDSLVARGFKYVPAPDNSSPAHDTLVGPDFEVLFGKSFPFAPPRVRTLVPTPQSWHLDNGGFLCLYTSEGAENLPWLDVDGFLNRVKDWYRHNEAGWPDDAPVLDLEAYLHLGVDVRIIAYENLNYLDNDYITLAPGVSGYFRVVGSGKVPKNRRRKQQLTGFVTNIGEVETPPRSWDDLLDRCPDGDKKKVKSAIRTGRVKVLLVRYRRGKQRGCLALWFDAPDDTPKIASAVSVDKSALRLRAGTDADTLATKHVYLIGAGALGSAIADLLNRTGIGTLTIRDHDIMRPGNLVRHSLGFREAHGLNKAYAVVKWLEGAPYSSTTLVPVQTALTDPADVLPIFDSCDLVVDATADGSVTRMLTDAAETSGQTFVSSCTKGEGRVLRVDIVPPMNGAEQLADNTPAVAYDLADAVFEDGCGDPVSRTPPYAITEAASMTVRHALALLKGEPLTDAGEVREC
jgi:hypothetical protein